MRKLILSVALILVLLSGCSGMNTGGNSWHGRNGTLSIKTQPMSDLQQVALRFTSSSNCTMQPTIKFIAYDENDNTIGSRTVWFDPILPYKSQVKTTSCSGISKIYKIVITNATAEGFLIGGVHGYTYTITNGQDN